MREMLHRCESFRGHGIGAWDTSSVKTMYAMFARCASFTGEGIGAWDTSSVTDMDSMFCECSSFTGHGIGAWDMSSVTDMSRMFYTCRSFIGDGIGAWDTSSVTRALWMFRGARAVHVDLRRWDMSNIELPGNGLIHAGNRGMFKGASAFDPAHRPTFHETSQLDPFPDRPHTDFW